MSMLDSWIAGVKHVLVGGFKHFLCLSLFGEDSHVDEYVSKGLKPPTRFIFVAFD